MKNLNELFGQPNIIGLSHHVKLFWCQVLPRSPFVQQIHAKHLPCAKNRARHWELNHKQSRQSPPSLGLCIGVEISKNKQIHIQYKRPGSGQYREEKLRKPSGWEVARLLVVRVG